jgi:hypothetical protein
MLPLKLFGGSPLCLSVSPGAAAQGSGLLTFLCASGVPELAILGNWILILVKNWKNHGVLVNFICTFIKKELTNRMQPLKYKIILLLFDFMWLERMGKLSATGGM